MEEQLDILFNDKAATGEWQYTTSGGQFPNDGNFADCYRPTPLEEDTMDDIDKVVIVDPKELSKKRLGGPSHGSRKLSGAARLSRSLDKMVEAVSSTGATPAAKGDGFPTSKACMEIVRAIPALTNDKEACVWAMKVFKNAANRLCFMDATNDEERLIWLSLEIQMEKAKYDKAISGTWDGNPQSK